MDSKLRQSKTTFLVKVQYGAFESRGLFVSRGTVDISEIQLGNLVIVRTSRGTEMGVIIGRPKSMPEGSRFSGDGALLRLAETEDVKQQKLIEDETTQSEWKLCLNLIYKHKLPITMVRIEHLLGGERVIFHFRAAHKVDFRAIVRDLAYRLRTRIEMHQIGGRDEARLMGCFGPCGRELCCRSFLNKIPSVSMKSVKTQFSSMNSQKMSGMCGHLRCCLKYEEEGYREILNTLPPLGVNIKYRDPDNGLLAGEVIGYDILNKVLRVRLKEEKAKVVSVPLEQVEDGDAGLEKRDSLNSKGKRRRSRKREKRGGKH